MSAYNEMLSELVQDLINSYDPYLDNPEHLAKPSDLGTFLKSHNIEVDQPLTDDQLTEAHQLRSQLRDLWTANQPSALIEVLNSLLIHSPVVLEVETDEKNGLHITYKPHSNLSVMQQLTTKSVFGLVTVLENYGLERMGTCMADPCQDVFIDVSRNRSRRFCSDRCANRYNIAAYRERNQDG